jgi:Primase C terminal 1 (PriCT-1)
MSRSPRVSAVLSGAELPDGVRNNHAISYAGSLRRGGASEEQILARLEQVNAEQCDPPMSQKELRTIAKSATRYKPEDNPMKGFLNRVVPKEISYTR